MKLIKHHTTKDKKYYKYELVIPNKAVEKAGLSEDDELEIEVDKGKKRIVVKEKGVRKKGEK